MKKLGIFKYIYSYSIVTVLRYLANVSVSHHLHCCHYSLGQHHRIPSLLDKSSHCFYPWPVSKTHTAPHYHLSSSKFPSEKSQSPKSEAQSLCHLVITTSLLCTIVLLFSIQPLCLLSSPQICLGLSCLGVIHQLDLEGSPFKFLL